MGSFYMESTQINYRRDETVKTVDQKLQELSETSAIDTDIAPVFKSTNTYAPGDMVYYRNKLYTFNVEHSGAWAAGDVTATDVTTEISSLRSGLTNYQAQNDFNLEVPNRKNLWDGNYTDIAPQTVTYKPIQVVDGNYTISTTCPQNSLNGANIFLLSGNVQEGASTSGNGAWEGHTKTVASANGYITIAYKMDGGVDPREYDTQIEYGSTATAFAPYIPSVESRIEAVESGVTDVISDLQATKTAQTITGSGTIDYVLGTDEALDGFIVGLYNKIGLYRFTYYDVNKSTALCTALNSTNGFGFILNTTTWTNHPLLIAITGEGNIVTAQLEVTSNTYSVSWANKFVKAS